MKTDNAHADIKSALRKQFTCQLPETSKILEAYAGFGMMYDLAWSRFRWGVCIDKKEEAAKHNSERRPTWACYAGDSVKLMRSSFYDDVPFDVVDFDCYGSPWPVFSAWCASDRLKAEKTIVFLTDGYRSRVAMSLPCKALWGSEATARMSIKEPAYFARVQRKVKEWTSLAGLSIDIAERWDGGSGTDYLALVLTKDKACGVGHATGRS